MCSACTTIFEHHNYILIWKWRRKCNVWAKGGRGLISGTEFKIIDTISREIGNPISIRGLTTEIKREFGSAHYPNIYNALLGLKDKNIIQIEKQGNASIPLLNFSNYLLPDMLIEIELQKKHNFLQKWPEAQFLLSNLDQALSALSFIRSILLIEPERNMRLNRAELLILIDQENLAKFGYKELGPEIRPGKDYSMEYIISSILMGDDPRRAAAASILISKNRPSFELLKFLSMRHGFAEKLLGLLEAINDISPAPE